MEDVNFDKVIKTLEEPMYVAVGFGVLAFQRAQVFRRELERHLGRFAGAANHVVGGAKDVVGGAKDHFAAAAKQASGSATSRVPGGAAGRAAGGAADIVPGLAGEIAGQLPDEAKEFFRAAVDVAGDIPKEARELLNEAIAAGRFAVKVLQGPVARRANP
jgi:uncharacterized protein YjbJ (UPF0337 family)